MRVVSAALVAAAACAPLVHGHCPNMCNGHGRCSGVNKCDCFEPWTGGDCSLQKCPKAAAWSDIASGTDVAHAPATCANRGLCDERTGLCKCFEGFEGVSCSRATCPDDCHGHGRCRSMRSLALAMDEGWPTFSYNNVWDADKLFGCECDPGYQGYNCHERVCPSGDDPLTVGQADEVQLLRCDLDPAGGQAFILLFRKAPTRPIPANADISAFKRALEEIETIGSVEVLFQSTTGAIGTVCDNSGAGGLSNNIVEVRFLSEHGDLPALVAKDSMGVSTSAVTVAVDGAGMSRGDGATILSVKGTKEDAPCSGRGRCDTGSGVCHCYTGFATSDGRGNSGTRGDCGFDIDPITSCPGVSIECSGHGVCSGHPTYKCACTTGWTGGDCAERTCPVGKAWTDEPSRSNDEAHAVTECSNRGLCNRATGQCSCQRGFEGEACERTTCPGKTVPLGVCSGHGQCLSMQDLGLQATSNGDATPQQYGFVPNKPLTWDFDQVHGCLCDDGWTGADCSLRTCVRGDDVTSKGDNDEVQTLHCTYTGAGSPTFSLKFRQHASSAIAFDATAAAVEGALEALPSIGDVAISFSDGEVSACSSGVGNTITISFLTEHGDVPPVTVVQEGFTQGVELTFGSLEAAEKAKGTTENAECNERGLCNRSTGTCACFVGFGSSNGQGEKGALADCGYREPYWPVAL